MYKTQNGWTKTKMIEMMKKFLPPTGRCFDGAYCLYQNESGYRCAAGAFLPDNHPAILAPGEFKNHPANLLQGVNWPISRDGITSLQSQHDMCCFKESAKEKCIQWIKANVED